MSLTICIIGRPNVGKSTLFNRIIGEPRALVHNMPGVTRDRLYSAGQWRIGDNRIPFTLIDTGGLEQSKTETLSAYVNRQVQIGIEEADIILIVVDGRSGLLPDDESLVRSLRSSGKKMVLCVNKIDLNLREDLLAPFHRLGINPIFPVSAEHNRGIDELMHALLKDAPESEMAVANKEDPDTIRLAIIGRPNVGKSRLLNYLCGEERVIVSDEPGTTRDPIDTKVKIDGQQYLLIDTAGIRRQAKISETLEYLTVLRSMRAVGRSHIAILVIDSTSGPTHQDLRLAQQIWLRGTGLICFYNKCDLIEGEKPKGFPHFPYVPTAAGSAKFSQGMEHLMKIVARTFKSYKKRVVTSKLNDIMERVTAAVNAPAPKGFALKVRYITQVGDSPPSFQIFVNRLSRLTKNYSKYLENSLYEELGLSGVPVRIEFKE